MNTKPEILIKDEQVWVFMGSDYKILDIAAAHTLISKLQSGTALAERNRQRNKHARVMAMDAFAP